MVYRFMGRRGRTRDSECREVARVMHSGRLSADIGRVMTIARVMLLAPGLWLVLLTERSVPVQYYISRWPHYHCSGQPGLDCRLTD